MNFEIAGSILDYFKIKICAKKHSVVIQLSIIDIYKHVKHIYRCIYKIKKDYFSKKNGSFIAPQCDK
jgi:hypothetical protein